MILAHAKALIFYSLSYSSFTRYNRSLFHFRFLIVRLGVSKVSLCSINVEAAKLVSDLDQVLWVMVSGGLEILVL